MKINFFFYIIYYRLGVGLEGDIIMNEKILITVEVPIIDYNFDILIPVNKKVGTIRKSIIDSINELTDNILENSDKLNLYIKDTFEFCELNSYVANTNIKNGCRLVLM